MSNNPLRSDHVQSDARQMSAWVKALWVGIALTLMGGVLLAVNPASMWFLFAGLGALLLQAGVVGWVVKGVLVEAREGR